MYKPSPKSRSQIRRRLSPRDVRFAATADARPAKFLGTRPTRKTANYHDARPQTEPWRLPKQSFATEARVAAMPAARTHNPESRTKATCAIASRRQMVKWKDRGD